MKNRLKVLRAEKDWTQADLADRAGVARQTIVALENGKYSPSLELAFRFSRIFGRQVEEIFTPDDGDDGDDGGAPQETQ
jgi:putative transcriptional regulator